MRSRPRLALAATATAGALVMCACAGGGASDAAMKRVRSPSLGSVRLEYGLANAREVHSPEASARKKDS